MKNGKYLPILIVIIITLFISAYFYWFNYSPPDEKGISVPVEGYGTTYYVSTSGDDSNSGTVESPWHDPVKSALKLKPGDTLIIKKGEYSLASADGPIRPSSGVDKNWITIKGENGAVLVGTDNLQCALDISGCSYLNIDGLEIKSDNTQFRDGITASGDPINQIIIQNVYIHHLDEFGIDLNDINNLRILNCKIEYCGYGSIGGPQGNAGGWRNIMIDNCTLSYSGHYYHGGDGSKSAYDRPDGFGIEASKGPITIQNTISEHNKGDGLDSKAENTLIKNCIVDNNNCDGVKLWGTGSRLENSLIYGRGDGNSEPTPWSPIVISSENANANFEIDHVTVDDFVGNNYLMHVQYDHQQTPIKLTVKNSILSGRGDSSPIFLASSVQYTFENNLFFILKSSFVIDIGGKQITTTQIGELGPGNIYDDPRFIETGFGSVGNYRLQNGSSAGNRGVDYSKLPLT
ncbi:MAG: right-handed parallel beta-helix repeat-containing protein [Methanobacterium sp.]|nr:right-handed parallel beta-helix repeat-containing protein [Methanobacterium sp.]